MIRKTLNIHLLQVTYLTNPAYTGTIDFIKNSRGCDCINTNLAKKL